MPETNVLLFPARPRPAAADALGSVANLVGEARARDARSPAWRPLRNGMSLRRGTEVMTGLKTRLTIALRGGDLIQINSVCCLILQNVHVAGHVRQLRVAARFGGLTLLPGGNRDRAFTIDPFPNSVLPPEAIRRTLGNGEAPNAAPSVWGPFERATDIVIAGDVIELRAVTCYRAAKS